MLTLWRFLAGAIPSMEISREVQHFFRGGIVRWFAMLVFVSERRYKMANLHHGAKAIVDRSTQPVDKQSTEKPRRLWQISELQLMRS